MADYSRQMFKQFNHFMLLMWRLGLGPLINAWPQVSGRILVLTHTGRKSGQVRRTPLNYAEIDGDTYIIAGFGPAADWYRNVLAHPAAQVWLKDSWYEVQAEDVSDSPDRSQIIRLVLINSGFAAIFAGLDPYTVSEAELAAKTGEYRIVRLRRTAPRTGPGGPGELAWVWPVAVFALLPLLLLPRRKRK